MSAAKSNIRKIPVGRKKNVAVEEEYTPSATRVVNIPSNINSSEVTPLDWDNQRSFVNYPNMVRLATIKDGSDYFHAILKGYMKDYVKGVTDEGKTFNKAAFVRSLRDDLANNLAAPYDAADPRGINKYGMLNNGQLAIEGLSNPDYSLAQMQTKLRSGLPVTLDFHEFISNELQKDVYILDSLSFDVISVGSSIDLCYKSRPPVVIVYNRISNQFDTVGLMDPEMNIWTFFSNTNPFIKLIKKRLIEKYKIK